MEKMTKRELQTLLEILKEGRVSDQEIARRLKTSRPSIAIIRKKLEEKGIILGYYPIIDFKKIGLEIQALTLFSWKDYSKQNEIIELKEFTKKSPNVIIEIETEIASKKTNALISIHTDVKQVEEFIQKLKTKSKGNIENLEVMISTIKDTTKQFNINSPSIDKIESELYSKLILPKKVLKIKEE